MPGSISLSALQVQSVKQKHGAPWCLMLGVTSDSSTSRVLHLLPGSSHLKNASLLLPQLPVGITIIGALVFGSNEDTAKQARNSLDSLKQSYSLVHLSDDGTSVSSSATNAGAAVEARLLAADAAAVEFGDIAAVVVSHQTQFLGTSVQEFVSQFDSLASSLSTLSSSSAAAADSTTTTTLAWEIQANKSLVSPAFQGRIIFGDEVASGEDSDENVWALLNEENPLVQRKKAQSKKAGGAAAASSAPGAVLALPEYAIEVSLLQSMTTSSSSLNAPTLSYIKAGKEGLKSLQVQLSAVAYVASPATSLHQVLSQLSSALQQQCGEMQTKLQSDWNKVTSDSSANKGCVSNRAFTMQALHFQPYQFLHSITQLYFSRTASAPATFNNDTSGWFLQPPNEEDIDAVHPNWILSSAEDSLKAQRESAQQLWNIPANTPAFRFRNALSFPSTPSPFTPHQFIIAPRLLNVHEFLFSLSKEGVVSHSGVSQGDLTIVEGNYAYYHYLQDKLHDEGWGCAYRTLQSICSFFVLQGYSQSVPVPTINDIQRILVELKDKEKRFIGSKEWIGSMEVGLILRYCYGIECKTMFVSSGSEVSSHSREFAQHFKTQGTPIMIGGGVLAYGLLGVDYNEHTGDVRYLILDPHYTGTDSIAPMLKGGWIGWKKADLFLADHFYNFAMPQRPKNCV